MRKPAFRYRGECNAPPANDGPIGECFFGMYVGAERAFASGDAIVRPRRGDQLLRRGSYDGKVVAMSPCVSASIQRPAFRRKWIFVPALPVAGIGQPMLGHGRTGILPCSRRRRCIRKQRKHDKSCRNTLHENPPRLHPKVQGYGDWNVADTGTFHCRRSFAARVGPMPASLRMRTLRRECWSHLNAV